MSTTTTYNETLPAGSAVVDAETYEPASAETVTLTEPRSLAAEQFRVLRYRLEGLAAGGVRALAFTSAQTGEGKTATIVNGAVALARGGKNRVVLVDADLRRPSVARMMGLNASAGLCDVVAGKTPLGNCLWRFGSDELFVLPAGQVPDDICNTLYDTRITSVLQELKQRFDFVLVDTPPLLAVTDPCAVVPRVDGVLLTVRNSKNCQPQVEQALEVLDTVGAKLLGVVVNAVGPQFSPTVYGYRDLARVEA